MNFSIPGIDQRRFVTSRTAAVNQKVVCRSTNSDGPPKGLSNMTPSERQQFFAAQDDQLEQARQAVENQGGMQFGRPDRTAPPVQEIKFNFGNSIFNPKGSDEQPED